MVPTFLLMRPAGRFVPSSSTGNVGPSTHAKCVHGPVVTAEHRTVGVLPPSSDCHNSALSNRSGPSPVLVTNDTSCGTGELPVNVTGKGTGSDKSELPVSVASIVPGRRMVLFGSPCRVQMMV